MKINKLDDKETVLEHKELIENKYILKKIYIKFYKEFGKSRPKKGKILELGSGGGIFKRIYPKSITSDVVAGPGIDKVFFAEKIPFKNDSLSAIYMLNVLHHIKDPAKGLKEMQRVLKKNGKIIMIEPYNSFWSRFIYKNFHHEVFDPKAGWRVKGKGRLSDANDALPWIIFVRDRKLFEQRFPNLKIVKIEPHTPFMYLLSGGLSKPQLIPNTLYKYACSVEDFLTPLNHYLGMFVTIVLEKKYE